MGRSIRWRIAWPYLLLFTITLTGLLWFTVRIIRREDLVRAGQQLTALATGLAKQSEDRFARHTGVRPFDELALKIADATRFDISFLDGEGELLGTSLANPPENSQTLPGVTRALTTGQGFEHDRNLLGAAVAVVSQSDSRLGIVQVQSSPAYFETDLTNLYWLSAIAFLAGGLGILLLTGLVTDFSQQSVESLTIAVEQMQQGNFSHLAFPAAPGELAELRGALQAMAQQLGSQIDFLTSERGKLSAVLNQMTDGVMIVDVEGRVQLINPAAERLFQVSHSEGLGRSFVELVRYQQLIDLWRKAKELARESMTLEIGPQHLFLQVVAIPLKVALPGSTMILFQDLTQLRRLETVRRDFVSNVSHELRTPLASLKALSETLLEGALDDPPAARRFIARMEIEIDNLAQMVNELLELSRIESGKVPIAFNRVRPYDLLRPSTERMVTQAERAGLNLVLDCDPNLQEVFADPDRITQVLINLIHNAIKFTPPGGKIAVSAYEEGDHIVFYVRDTGAGIARKDLGRIFERFYKADRARTGGGTGLGLSIARHMIESHGGYIWAESEEQVGSTFYFSLPVVHH